MSKGTQLYALFLLTLCAVLLLLFFYQSPRVRELNQTLDNFAEIRHFPWHFKVLKVEQGIVTVNSPISTEVPCDQVIGLIFPKVKGLSMFSEAYQNAQDRLAHVQDLIENTLLAEPDIHQVRWQLDRAWLIQQGINLPG